MHDLQKRRSGMASRVLMAGMLFVASASLLRADPLVYTDDDDDDGIINGIEDETGTLSLRSESPYVMRALEFSGGDAEVADAAGRYAVSNWTVEAWVRPTNGVTGFVPLISRRGVGDPQGVGTTFELGLFSTNGETRAYALFNRHGVADPYILTGGQVPLNDWTHLAASFTNSSPIRSGFFILYINGFEAVRGQNNFMRPVTPIAGTLYMGSSGFLGNLMEVRAWRTVRAPLEIFNNFRRLLTFSTEARENSFDGTSGTYAGRPTVAALPPVPSEDGFNLSSVVALPAPAWTFQRHTFSMEAYIRMEPGSQGGIITRRKQNVGSLTGLADDRPVLAENQVFNDTDSAEGPWAITESMEITLDGNLQCQWWGTVTHFPVAYGDRLARRFTKSDVDLRDGEWHHVAAVGDGDNIRLYIDGVLDTEGPYFRRISPPTATITAYIQFEDVATVLRIGQGGFDGIIDEASFWNDFLDPIEIARHRTFGLTLGDVAQQIQYYGFAPIPPGNVGMTPPWKTVPPLGAVAAGPGGTGVRHKRLVSYVVFDGTAQQATFIDDLANAAVQYRILPLPSGIEIVSVGRPPIAVDGLSRTFGAKMPGYFPGSDGTGLTPGNVENYMLRNFLAGGGVFSGAGANFVDLDKTDPVATEFLIMDSDNDGMPDWWETAHGIDPSAADAEEDRDGDGLSNLAEFQSGNKPFDPDSDGDGITDDAEDLDGDGLTNIQEQNVTHTHAGLYDTDDDGFSDNEEVVMGTDPLNAYSPSRPGAYQFDGTGRLKVRTELIGRVPLTSAETVTDLSRSWTVEAWIQSTNTTGEQIVVRRFAQYSGGATNWLHYELGVTNGWPYVAYQAGNARTNLIKAVAPTNSLNLLGTNWTHIAGVLDLNGSQLRLYVDGRRVTSVVAQPVPQILYDSLFETTIGGGDLAPGGVDRGFRGMIDAVRTWSYVRSGIEIQQARGVLLPEHTGLTPDESRSPKRLFNFDDCSVGPSTNSLYAQNSHYVNDWMIGWPHVAQATTSGAVWISTPFPPLNLDSDDDGVADEDERTRDWNVNRSESPFLMRYLHFPNIAGASNTVVVDEQVDAVETGIYALTNWSVEVWVRPTTVAGGTLVPLIQRRTKEAPGWVTFELGLTNSAGQIRPYALFHRDDAGHARVMLLGNAPTVNIRTGTNAAAWNHLAATFVGDRFSLYFDGNEVALSQVIGADPIGSLGGIVTVGSPGFEGDMREIRIWNKPRTAAEITDAYRKTLLFSPALLENVYNADQNAFLGRSTQSEENGLIYERIANENLGAFDYQTGTSTHKFALEAWVKMERGAAGGIVVERKIDVNLLPNDPDWRINNSLRITDDGRPQGVWQGEVIVVTPVYVPPALIVLSRLNFNQEIVTRNLTSEVDIRDGTWHHLALVGDSTAITLYIDGIRDTVKPYYTFMARTAPMFESLFFTYPPSNSVLRVADDGIEAHIDEVMVWNEDLSQESVIQHMNYGLSAREITQGLLDIAPLPDNAVGSGHHQRLVSYLTFDGIVLPPWVPDEANDLLPYRMLPLPAGNEIIVNARPPVRVDRLRGFDGKLAGYLGSVDGGNSVENYMQRSDLGYAGVMQSGVVFRVSSVDGSPEFSVGDADSDDLPDWWEIQYGLDPGSAEGADGSYGDPDGDGLTNAAELQAGTSPIEPDSDRDGLSDFFSWDLTTTNQFRIYGERFTDFDGMDDRWEVDGTLDPRAYDSHLDLDLDGWSNLSEFRSNINPTNFAIGRTVLPNNGTNWPSPNVTFKITYKGFRHDGPLRIQAYNDQYMDGVPEAAFTFDGLTGPHPRFVSTGAAVILTTNVTDNVTNVTSSVVATGFLREGPMWFFAYYDVNADDTWNEGEAAGFARRLPNRIGYSSAYSIDFELSESQSVAAQPDYELPGYGRFSWPALPNANNYRIVIRNRSLANSPVVVQRMVAAPRTYFHEWDYLLEGKIGLDAATYEWFVYHTVNNVDLIVTNKPFVVTYPASLTAPVPSTPNGTIWRYAQNTLAWTQSVGATAYRLQIATNAAFATMVLNHQEVVPVPNGLGVVSLRVPLRAGDVNFTNGTYYWRVQATAPGKTSAWSATRTLGVDLTDSPAGPYSISGELIYVGKVTNSTFVVQAYRSPDFSLEPVAQAAVANTSSSNGWPRNMMAYSIRGLTPGTYYVRGFLDQNGDRARQSWESDGFVRANAYLPRAITVPASATLQDIMVVFADTDNDRIADDWEFQYTGNITTMGAGTVRGYTDQTPLDFYNDFESYAASRINISPIDPFAHFADGVPLRVKAAFGLDPASSLYFDIAGVTFNAQGNPIVHWYALPGGVSQGGNGRGIQANDGVAVQYQVEYSSDLNHWTIATVSGSVVYDSVSNVFRYIDPVASGSNRVYRYRVDWSF